MGLVAFTLGFAALGAFIARNFTGGSGFVFLILEVGCIVALNAAAARGREQLATGLLFALGLLAGMFIAPFVNYYAHADPGAVYQAAGSTALFTGVLGSWGYLTRRDLSSWGRPLFFALMAVLVVGLITLLVAVPGGNVIYCVLGLLVIGGLTAFDFNRLARMPQYTSAVPIAAAIFLDIFNVFIFMLSLFGGGGSSRR
jgi:modulator of FtsH protease